MLARTENIYMNLYTEIQDNLWREKTDKDYYITIKNLQVHWVIMKVHILEFMVFSFRNILS